MFGAITNLVAQLVLRSLGDPTVSRVGLPYHEQIYQAIRDKDPERARSAIAGHLSVAERTYGADYDRPLDILAQRELARSWGTGSGLGDVSLRTLLLTKDGNAS
jgi:hypothetical protein